MENLVSIEKKSLMRLGKAQHCCFTWDIKVPFMCILKRHLNYTKLSNYAKLHKLLTTQSGEPEGLLQGRRQEVVQEEPGFPAQGPSS